MGGCRKGMLKNEGGLMHLIEITERVLLYPNEVYEGVIKKALLGWVCLLSTCLAHGGGEDLYKQGAAVYKTDPVQAFGLFAQAAEVGNSSGMVGAGHCCETGTGTAIDYATAIKWYEKAIAYNSLKACEGLARIYASCDDPEFHDGEKAVKYASVLARKKPRDADALALLAAAHARNVDFKKAEKVQRTAQRVAPLNELKEYKKQVQKYVEGEPRPSKATEAWIFRAADADMLWAVVKLVHLAGDPDREMYNPQLALKMCQKGIDKGKFDLYIQQGNLYLDTGDLEQAYESYQASCRHNYRSIETLLYRHLKNPPEKVFLWGEKHRDGYKSEYTVRVHTGYEPSSYINGRYIRGAAIYKDVVKIKMVPPSWESALYLFKIAKKQGHLKAAEELQSMEREMNAYKRILENKKGRDDRTVAMAVREEAAKYKKGGTFSHNLKLAETLYKKSYELNPLGETAYDLAELYLCEEFTPQVGEAINWLEIAHSKKNYDASLKLIEIYACSEDSALWNGERALEYATALVEGSSIEKHDVYRLLACAYARNRKFSKAERVMNKAIDLLGEYKDSNKSSSRREYQRQKTKYEQLCHSFKRGEPWPPIKD